MKKLPLIFAALASTVLSASAASVVGVTTDNLLVHFDTSAPSVFTSSFAITGLKASDGVTNDPGATLVNLTYNPTTNTHYGIDTNANFYSVGLNGVATIIDNTFSPIGFSAGFAHDPFTDKMVFASDAAENIFFAANGTRTTNPNLVYGVGDANFGYTPDVYGLGIDPITGEAYFLDSLGILAKSFDPNFSELFTIGSLGGAFTPFGALYVDYDGVLWGSLSTDGLTSSLYTIDTTTGVATSAGSFGAGIGMASIASIPEPSRVLFLGIAFVVLMFRRRR